MSDSAQNLEGKVVVVTGANSGIGFEAARAFSLRGAEVVMICRSAQRGEAARQHIMQTTANDKAHLYLADFESLSSVSELARKLLAAFPKVHVLCNNAGTAYSSRKTTPENFEATFAANHLSGFLLTTELLPALGKAATEDGEARVVFTSSLGHKNSALDFDDLNLCKGYSTLRAYGRSKLMNLLTARELQNRVGGQNIIVSSYHPGQVRTAIWGKSGILARLLGLLMYPFMWSAEKGADTLVWLATSADPDSINAEGGYFYDRQRAEEADFATDAAATTLWQMSDKLVQPYRSASPG